MQSPNLSLNLAALLSAVCLSFIMLTNSACQELPLFGSAPPPIAYLGWDQGELNQIYVLMPGEEPQPLTSEEEGVYDFITSPSAGSIIYSTVAMDGMSTLKRVDLAGSAGGPLVTCHQAQCTPLAWSSDGLRAIYERRPLREDDTSGEPELWWLDVEGGTSEPLLDDDQARATGGGFSPDGKWLSYISPAEETVVLYNLEDGRIQTIGSEIGVPPSWDPTGEKLVVPLLDLVIVHGDEGDDHLEHTHDYVTATHLFVIDVGSGERQNISGELGVEDSAPAYSPDGQWVAFGRRHYGTTANRQLWLMKADGTEQQLLLDDPAYTHGPPAWSPDGRYLLFQRFPTDGSSDKPGVWILNLETRELEELIDKGMEPLWLAGSA